ncbi:MAG: hypothetical protein GF320_06275 [Armatimonadia bacterium]|nr:hypothetical protein [Armatimonadia bacterium]
MGAPAAAEPACVDVHRHAYFGELMRQVDEVMAASGQQEVGPAFTRVAAAWMGLGTGEGDVEILDGPGDKGVDLWSTGPGSFLVYQAKAHEMGPHGKPTSLVFDSDGVEDLHRAFSLLASDEAPAPTSKGLHALWISLDHSLRQWADTGPEGEPLLLDLHLVILGNRLTKGGMEDLRSLDRMLAGVDEIRGFPVRCRAHLLTLDDLIAARWRQENREWRDLLGRKDEVVDLTAEDAGVLGNGKGCVFYCRAVDLVHAFERFGYQLFEPNVRCNIRKSKVNRAIRESVLRQGTRRAFRYLNNGLTIVTPSYQTPRDNRPAVRVTRPGIVNGLQTVVALHDGYHALDADGKADFEERCFVLVRLVREGKAADVSQIVRATNTQNPMHPRNLVSNNPEQIMFERLLAERGWFYERKDGAWDAFRGDPKRWRTLEGKRPTDFEAPGKGRKRERRASNEEMAQAWVSFVGFSEVAVHHRRDLFDVTEGGWYDLAFRKRTLCHGAEVAHRRSGLEEQHIRQGSPDPSLLLAAYLARRFAKRIAPAPKENRERTATALGLDPKATPPERLVEDPGYILGQALFGMSYAFAEALGYMLYSAFGEHVHDVGDRLLANGSLRALAREHRVDSVARRVAGGKSAASDVLAVAWGAFAHVVKEMIAGPWRGEFLAVANKQSITYKPGTRIRIREGLDELDAYARREQITRPWASGIRPPEGLFGFLRRQLVTK